MGSDESHFNVSLIVRDKVKTVSTDHNFWRERRAETDSNRGPCCIQQRGCAFYRSPLLSGLSVRGRSFSRQSPRKVNHAEDLSVGTDTIRNSRCAAEILLSCLTLLLLLHPHPYSPSNSRIGFTTCLIQPLPKLREQVYDILLPTAAIIDYVTRLRKLSAKARS